MPSVNIYNNQGKVTGELALNEKHFGVKVNSALVHEVLMGQRANARHPIANTKTKGEVRGGGKKPWKQKGTGRARQGSIRSPQWVGGGIAFGPRKETNFSVKVNRKARQKALFMVLSDKVTDQKMFVLESFAPESPKTKFAAELFKKLPIARKALAIIPKSDPALMRMVRNLTNVKLVTVNALNLEDLLSHQNIVFWQEAIPAFELLYRNA